MLPPSVFLCAALQLLSVVAQPQNFFDDPYQSNSIDCQNDQMCTFIENCPAILNLMSQDLLPIHRFRQAVCGYENIKVKVCCDLDNGPVNPEDGSPSRRSNSIMECGKSYIDSDYNALGVYPFVARIGFLSVTGETRYPCSGVILNERTILSTASCSLTKTDQYKLHSVLVGEFNAETDPDCSARKHNISYVIKHPYYDENTFANNIAMLRLREPIQYTETVQPICLPPPDMHIGPGGSSVLVGWGKLSSQRIKVCQQQCLRMRIASAQECSNYYAQGYSIELCATGDEMPCSGYNGSPLLFKYGDTYFLVGILSYGSNCNSTANYPTVFVDVQKYIRWIIENC